MRRALPLLTLLAVPACVGPPSGHRPVMQPAPVASVRPDMKQCVAGLQSLGARYTILPDRDYSPGCSAINSVTLTGAGVPITNISAIQCELASALTLWVRGSVQQAAKAAFGERVVKIETMGAYSCRNVIGGRGTGLSEHASANAIDVSAFMLSDGRRVTIQQGWNGSEDERDFLRAIRKSACARFQTVLSPDYNAAHHNHLHFDMGRGPYCR
jgi:hypothetical protein